MEKVGGCFVVAALTKSRWESTGADLVRRLSVLDSRVPFPRLYTSCFVFFFFPEFRRRRGQCEHVASGCGLQVARATAALFLVDRRGCLGRLRRRLEPSTSCRLRGRTKRPYRYVRNCVVLVERRYRALIAERRNASIVFFLDCFSRR